MVFVEIVRHDELDVETSANQATSFGRRDNRAAAISN